MRSLKHRAHLILLTFVVGSIFAPASHYSFMMFSDLYGFGGHMDHLSSHHEHAILQAHLSDAGAEHLECEYADLFATFVAANSATASVVDVEPTLESHFNEPVEVFFAFQASPFHQRGPPSFL